MVDDSQPAATPSSQDGGEPGAMPHFDADDRGCGDGIAKDLRQRIEAVDVGSRLQVTVRDPSAKADIPAVTRMLGHRIVSEEPFDDGRLVIIVERGK